MAFPKAVNSQLIELYWSVGAHLSEKVASAGWGKGTVQELARYIAANQPAAKGFSARNLWRMLQFHETYAGNPILSPLVTELPWTHNLLIMSRCRSDEEREFYLRYCAKEGWGKRELERQLAGALFERVALAPKQQSASLREIHPEAASVFKDSYLVDFLQLPAVHSESDLQRALLERLRQFLLELGRDFCFIDSEFPLQVGGRDFAVDLLLFNRSLNCLVAI